MKLAPAVTGNEYFERAYRVHINTLEQMVFFLPSMWLYAMLLTDKGAAVGGLICRQPARPNYKLIGFYVFAYQSER